MKKCKISSLIQRFVGPFFETLCTIWQ